MKKLEHGRHMLVSKDLLFPGTMYQFVRVDDEFAYHPVSVRDQRVKHNNLALSSGLAKGRSDTGKPVVSDAGYFIPQPQHVDMLLDYPSTVQLEALDGINLQRDYAVASTEPVLRIVRSDTAQGLANVLNLPVVLKFKPLMSETPVEVLRFEPEQ